MLTPSVVIVYATMLGNSIFYLVGEETISPQIGEMMTLKEESQNFQLCCLLSSFGQRIASFSPPDSWSANF